MTRNQLIRPLVGATIVYTLANGYVHLHEWLAGYRRLPASLSGSWVVRLGFPAAAATAIVLTAVLAVAATRRARFVVPALVLAAGFHAATLGLLIATRTGSVFGRSEPVWTPGANQTRLVAAAGLAMAAATVLARFTSRATAPSVVPTAAHR
jgi:hypothetical protein